MERIKSRAVFEKFQERLKKLMAFTKGAPGAAKNMGFYTKNTENSVIRSRNNGKKRLIIVKILIKRNYNKGKTIL